MTTEITGRYIEVFNTKTYYERMSSAAGKTVIALHTAGRDCRQWHGLMETLHPEYDLIALDFPGHSKSWPLPGEKKCLDSSEDFVKFIWEFVDVMGIVDPIFMGASVGGNLVFALAQNRPKQTRAIISFSGSDFSPPAAPPALLNHPHINVADFLYDRTTFLIGSKAPASIREFLMYTVRQVVPDAIYADLYCYGNFDVREGAPMITCPTLLFWGNEDWLVTREMVEASFERLANSVKREWQIIDGGGHFVHAEQPDECARRIKKFLNSL